MPTRYWLVDPDLRDAVSRLESTGGVRQAEAAVGMARITAAHARYADERDALIPPDHQGRDPPVAWVAPGRGSSACMPIWPGGSPGPRIRSGEWTAQRIGLHPA